MSARNRLRTIAVPRNCADRQTVPAWEDARDALDQHGRALSEYSCNVPLRPNTRLRVLDAKYSPVGLWNFHLGAGVGPKDYSGNGFDLTTEAGTARYSALHPTLGGILFDGATNLIYNTATATLRLLGASTVLVLGMWSDLPAGGNVRSMVQHNGAGETSDTNYLYRWAIDPNNQFQYFSEHLGGIDDVAQNNTMLPRTQVGLIGGTRSSGGVLNHWENGTVVGGSFGTVTLPTDGSNGRFRIGGNGAGEWFTGVISSVALYAQELTAAQMIERYNYAMGAAYGYRSTGVTTDDLRPIYAVDEDSELLSAKLVPDVQSGAFAAADVSFSLYRIDSSGSLATAQLLANIDPNVASATAWSPFRAKEMHLVTSPAVVRKGDVLAISGKTQIFSGDLDLRFGRISA